MLWGGSQCLELQPGGRRRPDAHEGHLGVLLGHFVDDSDGTGGAAVADTAHFSVASKSMWSRAST